MLIVDWHRIDLLRLRVCGLQEKAATIWFDMIRPVIVAENMIGCAMYELVCGWPTLEITLKNLIYRQGPRRSRQSGWRGHSNRSR